MSRPRLRYLYEGFVSETAAIQHRFEYSLDAARAPTFAQEKQAQYCREMCVIRLHDSWTRFSRELVVQSAACEALTDTGSLLVKAPGIASPADVINEAKRIATSRFEPRWGDPTTCLKIAASLRIANLGIVSGALGSTPAPFENLRAVRNYLAHRNRETASRVAIVKHAIRVQSVTTVDGIICSIVAPDTPLLIDWIYSMRVIALAAVQ